MGEKTLAPATTVRVTDEDIKEGFRQDQFQCAITLAIQRRYPTAKLVRVNKKHIAFSIDETRFVYNTPQVAIEAVIEPFDQGKPVEPILLRLDSGIMREVMHREPLAYRDKDRRRKEERQIGPDNPNHTKYQREYSKETGK